MENIDNTQEDQAMEVTDQIDFILRNLDLHPLPGYVVGTLCQARRYIDALEQEIINLNNKHVLEQQEMSHTQQEN
jgi:hypothetical protein